MLEWLKISCAQWLKMVFSVPFGEVFCVSELFSIILELSVRGESNRISMFLFYSSINYYNNCTCPSISTLKQGARPLATGI